MSKKVALCFIISYDHVLSKEHIWREWIEENQDICNVYFFYKDYNKIKSPWVKLHALPPSFIYPTTYTNIIPAYLSLITFASQHDENNQWFCFLTDSCCPIAPPEHFRKMFFKFYDKTVLRWGPAWWNPTFQKRANIGLLPQYLRLAHDPYFILNRFDAMLILHFVKSKVNFVKVICEGGVANESLFAVILNICAVLDKTICDATHMTDWTRMTSPTSPYVFHDENNETDVKFIEDELKASRDFKFFIRKVNPLFPDKLLRHYIYEKFYDSNKLFNRKKDSLVNNIIGIFVFVLIFSLLNGLVYYFTH